MGLMSEFRRHNVFRMVVLYLVAVWPIMQVAEVVITLANLPDCVGPTILGLLAVGFPIALHLSFGQSSTRGDCSRRSVAQCHPRASAELDLYRINITMRILT